LRNRRISLQSSSGDCGFPHGIAAIECLPAVSIAGFAKNRISATTERDMGQNHRNRGSHEKVPRQISAADRILGFRNANVVSLFVP